MHELKKKKKLPDTNAKCEIEEAELTTLHAFQRIRSAGA